MGVAYPAALWGLLLLAVPLYLHFFGFRLRQKAFFTRLDWLLQQEIPVRRREQLRKYLLLATRMGIVLALVLAMAGLDWSGSAEGGTGGAAGTCVVYLDNSPSMGLEGSAGPLLEQAKSRVRALVQGSGAGVRFALLTNDPRPLHGGWLSRAMALEVLDRVALSGQTRGLASVLLQADQRLEMEGHDGIKGASVWLFSDFQKSSLKGLDLKGRPGTNAPVYTVPCRAENAWNAVVDSAWLLEPMFKAGQANQVVVRTRSYGSWPKGQTLQLELKVMGARKALTAVEPFASGLHLDTLGFVLPEQGPHLLELKLNDPLFPSDNVYRFSAQARRRISVLQVGQARPNPYIESVWRTDSLFDFTTTSAVEAVRFPLDSFDLVVLELEQPLQESFKVKAANWVKQGGGHLVVFPNSKMEVQAAANLASVLGTSLTYSALRQFDSRAAAPEDGSPFWGQVLARRPLPEAMPKVQAYYPMQVSTTDQVIWRLAQGDPLVVRSGCGEGWCYWVAVPAEEDYTDWVMHGLFLPFLYRVAVGSPRSRVFTGTLGGNAAWALPMPAGDNDPGDWRLRRVQGSGDALLEDASGAGDYLPEIRRESGQWVLRSNSTDLSPGWYRLMQGNSQGDPVYLAINQNPEESDLASLDNAALKDLNPNGALLDQDRLSVQEAGLTGPWGMESLRRWLLGSCLVFLALEAWLHAQRKA
jgi:hypothetical protein